MVNTTTAGPQIFSSVSAQADGGYTVAWIDNNMAVAIQRYDSAGGKVGTEVSVPYSQLSTTAISQSSVAVLRDGSVVVVYETNRLPDEPFMIPRAEGVFFQRFDANGTQLSGETPVVSRVEFNTPPLLFRAAPKAAPLADGGFVVTWVSTSFDTSRVFVDLFKQRYDSQAQAVGGNVSVSHSASSSSFSFYIAGRSSCAECVGFYALNADMQGGYTLTMFRRDTLENNLVVLVHGVSVTYFDAADRAKEIIAPRAGNSLLLPLAGDRFVLFTTACVPPDDFACGSALGGGQPRSTDTFRQFLDSAGNPVGEATRVASMPVAATELADGSYIVFLQAAGGGFTAQRFDANGAALGDAVAVDAIPSGRGVAALNGGSLALGWSATPPGGDLDVFTQRVLVQN
jgi:hypothetical protein